MRQRDLQHPDERGHLHGECEIGRQAQVQVRVRAHALHPAEQRLLEQRRHQHEQESHEEVRPHQLGGATKGGPHTQVLDHDQRADDAEQHGGDQAGDQQGQHPGDDDRHCRQVGDDQAPEGEFAQHLDQRHVLTAVPVRGHHAVEKAGEERGAERHHRRVGRRRPDTRPPGEGGAALRQPRQFLEEADDEVEGQHDQAAASATRQRRRRYVPSAAATTARTLMRRPWSAGSRRPLLSSPLRPACVGNDTTEGRPPPARPGFAAAQSPRARATGSAPARTGPQGAQISAHRARDTVSRMSQGPTDADRSVPPGGAPGTPGGPGQHKPVPYTPPLDAPAQAPQAASPPQSAPAALPVAAPDAAVPADAAARPLGAGWTQVQPSPPAEQGPRRRNWLVAAPARGIALFLGGFTLVSTVGVVRDTGFDANTWWVAVPYVPRLASAALLAAAGVAFVAYGVAPRMRAWRRWLTVAFFAFFAAVTAYNAFDFYRVWSAGDIAPGVPLPLSLVVTAGRSAGRARTWCGSTAGTARAGSA